LSNLFLYLAPLHSFRALSLPPMSNSLRHVVLSMSTKLY